VEVLLFIDLPLTCKLVPLSYHLQSYNLQLRETWQVGLLLYELKMGKMGEARKALTLTKFNGS
jgi:hypothetical protein